MYLGETGRKFVITADTLDCDMRTDTKCPECTTTRQKRFVCSPDTLQCHNYNPLLERKWMGSNSRLGRPLLIICPCRAKYDIEDQVCSCCCLRFCTNTEHRHICHRSRASKAQTSRDRT